MEETIYTLRGKSLLSALANGDVIVAASVATGLRNSEEEEWFFNDKTNWIENNWGHKYELDWFMLTLALVFVRKVDFEAFSEQFVRVQEALKVLEAQRDRAVREAAEPWVKQIMALRRAVGL